MTIKKEDMTPGTRLRILSPIKWGMAYSKGAPEPQHIDVTDYKAEQVYEARPGDVLEVVKKPRRYGPAMANCARVKVIFEGEAIWEGEAFWCMLRASCELVTEGAAQ